VKHVGEQRLLDAAADPVLLNSYNQVVSAYRLYREPTQQRAECDGMPADGLVAYFCA